MPNDVARIIYVTCCENGLFGLGKLVEKGHAADIAVLTIAPKVAEAAQVSGYADVRPFCERFGIAIRVMDNYKISEDDLTWLATMCPDILLVNGWNRLLPNEALGIARHGAYGVHAGHPPRGRGRAPIAWSLINGLRDIEVYLFCLTPSADDGDVVALRRIEITTWDDARSLYDKIMLVIGHIYLDVMDDLLSGKLCGQPQPKMGATYNLRRSPEDGMIDWSLPTERLHDFIRGQSEPYPGAFTFLDGHKLVIRSGHPFDRILDLGTMQLPGRILEILPSGVVVATGTTPYLIRAGEFPGPRLAGDHAAWAQEIRVGSLFIDGK